MGTFFFVRQGFSKLANILSPGPCPNRARWTCCCPLPGRARAPPGYR